MAKRRPSKPRSSGPSDRSGQASSSSRTSARLASAKPVARRGRDLLLERDDVGERSEQSLVAVGRLGRPWGVRGDITLRPYDPGSDISWADEVVWLKGEGFPLAAVEVEAWTLKGGKILMRFSRVESPEDVSALTHLDVLVPKELLPEPDEDEHYVHELLDMVVIDEVAGELGRIVDVFPTGANDVWVVRGERGEVLLPAIRGVIKSVDREARRILVRYEEF